MIERKRRKADPPAPERESTDTDDQTAMSPGPRQPRPYPDPIDDTLNDTFPASDPPSWWGG